MNNSAKNKKVLVTGASGQLGRKLIPVLIARGYKVTAHYRTKEKAIQWCPSSAKPVYGDLEEPSWLRSAARDCEFVIHCAARVSLRHTKDTSFDKINTEGTRSIINACLFNNVRRLIHISSVAAVGGSTDESPLDETAPFNLSGYGVPYFETKRESEQIVLDANSDKLQTVVVNPSIMISPPDRDLTKSDLERVPSRIPAYFDFGINLVQTEDVIDGIIAAMEKGGPGERYILAGENVSARYLIGLARKYLGIKKPLFRVPYPVLYFAGCLSEIISSTFSPFRKVFPGSKFNRDFVRLSKLRFYYSSDKAGKELGYNPRSLDQSIKEILKGVSRQVIRRESQIKKAAV